MALRDALRTLAILRGQQDEAHQQLRQVQDALEATAEYASVLAARERVKAITESAEFATAGVRDWALEAYRMTGDKHPEGAVTIRMHKRYVWDHEEVRDWLMLNAPVYLRVDAKGFEKAAASLKGAPVVIEHDPRPAIASDLSAFLVEARTAAEAE